MDASLFHSFIRFDHVNFLRLSREVRFNKHFFLFTIFQDSLSNSKQEWLITALRNPSDLNTAEVLCTYQCNAGRGGEAGHRVGILLFSKICNQIPCPQANHSSQMQPNFPTPDCTLLSIPKLAKKGTIKISPNKTLQSFINVAASPKIHVPVTTAIIRFNHNPCYTA